LALALAVTGLGNTARGHKLNVFAVAEGNVIRGEAFSRDGTPVREAKVAILDPAGDRLGETTTDGEGKFSFEARFRCDHHLVLDAGAGHVAKHIVRAEELPGHLPARGAAAASPDHAAERPEVGATSGSPSSGSAPGSLEEKLDNLIRQITELRKQINRYEQRKRFHDVLGGIGYIVGLSGLAFYFLGARRKQRP
jgi:nickel transport protein